MLRLLSAYRGEQRRSGVLCRFMSAMVTSGVSAKCYEDIKEKNTSFSCFACSQVSHEHELSALKDTVELLKREIADLKSSVPTSVHPVARPDKDSASSVIPSAHPSFIQHQDPVKNNAA